MNISQNEYQHYEKYSDKCKFKSPEEEFYYAQVILKKCNKCSQELPLTNFGLNTSGSSPFDKDGYRYRRGDCQDCNSNLQKGKLRAKKLAKSFGIDSKASEGTKCELCGSTDKIVFDHDHSTEEFRGWLCDPCNRSQGILETRIGSDWIEKLKLYHNKKGED